MSEWGNSRLRLNSPSAPSSPVQPDFKPPQPNGRDTSLKNGVDPKVYDPIENSAPPSPTVAGRTRGQSNASQTGSRPASRRNSLALGYQAPIMEVSQNTPAELQGIYTYLNSHSNKLYQEGYFLKLHDLDSRGRPSTDRVWNECFAQLVGTVLSLWDAAQLDAAPVDGEVIPTFINLTDASIKMIESLPMNGVNGQALQNVLSISTAANNRFLLHFNSLHSLTQWTAAIRLAMFEYTTLQEAYTGSILAGKGKHLNNIKSIMERSRFPTDDWVQVRFGAGTQWRPCWCVISPPDEKAFAKAQKSAKKKSAYDRSMPTVKGDIKFYDTKKITKKTQPIATVTDAFAAYSIYPQNQALVEQSTLIKVEGTITIHGNRNAKTEGFVFVMPDRHHAISGFEMMLRWLIPTFDTFALYGRPNRLIADALDTRSLMFAMPNSSRYGYLELIDVAGLIHTEGSSNWGEREWRRQLKILTSKRITSAPSDPGQSGSTVGRRRGGSRSSVNLPSMSRSTLNLTPTRNGAGVAFGDESANTRSTPGSRHGSPALSGPFAAPARSETVPVEQGPFSAPHKRAASDRVYRPNERSRLSFETQRDEAPPPPPKHGTTPASMNPSVDDSYSEASSSEHLPSSREPFPSQGPPQVDNFQPYSSKPMQPVQMPPEMAHNYRQRPPVHPNTTPEMRRANAAMDSATMARIEDSNARQGRYGANYGADPSYGPSNGYYTGSPHDMMGGGNAPMRERRAPPGKLGPPSMPTIPGTPALEHTQFDLTTADSRRPPMHQSDPSAGSVRRKPVGPGSMGR
ncbi:MAG: hypothetical protein Q9162_000615 [Coniocarpon cinnabarinum]